MPHLTLVAVGKATHRLMSSGELACPLLPQGVVGAGVMAPPCHLQWSAGLGVMGTQGSQKAAYGDCFLGGPLFSPQHQKGQTPLTKTVTLLHHT